MHESNWIFVSCQCLTKVTHLNIYIVSMPDQSHSPEYLYHANTWLKSVIWIFVSCQCLTKVTHLNICIMPRPDQSHSPAYFYHTKAWPKSLTWICVSCQGLKKVTHLNMFIIPRPNQSHSPEYLYHANGWPKHSPLISYQAEVHNPRCCPCSLFSAPDSVLLTWILSGPLFWS